MTRAKDISKIVSDANFGGTLDVAGVLTGASLDISGDIDVDGTTNLDVVDIDGAVQLGASGDDVRMTLTGNNQYRLTLVNGTAASVILGSGGANNFRVSNSSGSTILEVDASGNIIQGTSNAGIYLGVTSATASNLLDDYEEGTWTPSFVVSPQGTVSALAGQYTKIGRLVYIQVQVTGSSLGISSYARIGGLPFTANNDSDTGTYILGSIVTRGHGWTTIAGGSDQWYFSTAGTVSSNTQMSASAVYRTDV